METKDPEQKNSYVLRLGGKAELPNPLTIGHNYKITIDGSITAITESDNDDGSHTFYHKFQPIIVEMIDKKGERIKAKDTRRKSQLLRSCLWRKWQDSGENIEFDEFYDKRMTDIINKVIEGEL